MNTVKIIAWLARYGYLDAAWEAIQNGGLFQRIEKARELVKQFLGQDVEQLVDQPRCGCSDYAALNVGEATGLVQWPYAHKVKIWLADPPVNARLNKSAWADVFNEACKSWCKHGEKITWQIVDAQPSDGFKVFNGREDGANGVLAWCELPTNGVRLYQMKFDSAEDWGGRMDPVAVACHELGHGFGLDHIAPSKGEALMNPSLGRLKAPAPLDIAQFQARYGKPSTVPPPVDPPPPPPGQFMTWTDGRRYRVEAA